MKYFMGKDGLIYDERDLVRAYRIIEGHKVVPEVIPDYIHVFRGIEKEITPTVDDFIKAGQKASAVKFYYDSVNNDPSKENISIKEAKEIIDGYMEKEGIN